MMKGFIELAPELPMVEEAAPLLADMYLTADWLLIHKFLQNALFLTHLRSREDTAWELLLLLLLKSLLAFGLFLRLS